MISVAGMTVRIIAGRVEHGDRRSALVVIPTTESYAGGLRPHSSLGARVRGRGALLSSRRMGRQPAGDRGTSGMRGRRALPSRVRKRVTREQIEQALERLVTAGPADRDDDGNYVVRTAGSEAWLRLSLREPDVRDG